MLEPGCALILTSETVHVKPHARVYVLVRKLGHRLAYVNGHVTLDARSESRWNMTSSVHRENARCVRRGLAVLVRPLFFSLPLSTIAYFSPPLLHPPLDCFSPLLASGGKKKKKKEEKEGMKGENKGSSTTLTRGARFGTIRLAFRIVGHCLFVTPFREISGGSRVREVSR